MMHLSQAHLLHQKLLVPNVSWWINPSHTHRVDYSICQCLRGPHQWNEHREHLAFFISQRLCSILPNNNEHSVRAEFMICINSFGFWKTLDVGFEFHIKVDGAPFHFQPHENAHTQFIVPQLRLNEGHPLFNDMQVSIKERSLGKKFVFFFLPPMHDGRVLDICCCRFFWGKVAFRWWV